MMMPTNTYLFLEIRRMFGHIYAKLFVDKIWINYYMFCRCTGAAATTGLAFAQWFVGRAVVDLLITYFTDWKKYNLLKAVAIVNLLKGLSSVLVVPMTYISENHVSRLKVIVYSTAAYILGMVMLCISAFHSNIPDDNIWMYFAPPIIFISVGISGGVSNLEEFLIVQLTAHEPRLDKNEGRVNARKTVLWIAASLLSGILATKILSNANWCVKFIWSTSVLGVGWLLFLCCIPRYHRSVDDATTTEISGASPKENISVDKATTTYVSHATRLEKNNKNGPVPVCAGSLPQQWKHILKMMIPMWSTYLVFSVVLSTADTFFSEQGNNMRPTVSIYILLMIKNIIKSTASSTFSTLLAKYVPKPQKTKGIMVGIWIAMVLSICCCSISWIVEEKRLHAIEDAAIPMSIMWLAPQFCLLGLTKGIGKRGLDLFFEAHVSDVPMKKYGSALNEGVIGVGNFLNDLLVFLFRSWFRDTLNSSRLDNYYHMLTVASWVNMCYYWCVYSFYSNKKETKDEQE